MALTGLTQSLISGAAAGFVYCLMASGLQLGVAATGLYNLAHGAAVVAAAYAALLSFPHLPTPLWAIPAFLVGILLALAAFPLAGALMRRGGRWGLLASLAFTLAMGLLIEAVLLLFFGASPRRLPLALSTRGLGPWPVRLAGDRALAAALSLPFLSLLDRIFVGSRLGRSLRAAGSDPDLARTYGLDPARLFLGAALLAGSAAGVAGALYPVLFVLEPHAIFPLFVSLTLTAAVGPARPLALLPMGAALGALEGASSYLLGASWRPAVFFLAFAIFLLAREGRRAWA